MTDVPISPLRRRMIEDMTVRKLAARTQEGYIRAVKGFSAFLGTSPDTANAEDLRRYRLKPAARFGTCKSWQVILLSPLRSGTSRETPQLSAT
jgi:hypothetical protein